MATSASQARRGKPLTTPPLLDLEIEIKKLRAEMAKLAEQIAKTATRPIPRPRRGGVRGL